MSVTKGGTNICGLSMGVLALESYSPRPRGHIKPPSSLPCSRSYEVIDNLALPEPVNARNPETIAPQNQATRNLQAQSAKAILPECTDLPPCAPVLQDRLQRPVSDLITLASRVDSATRRRSFSGFIH